MVFVGILFFSSIAGLIVGKNKERIAMSLTSIQAAVVTAAAVSMIFKFKDKADRKVTEFYISILALVWSILVFGASYFSRYVAIFFVCLAMNYSVVWTVFYVLIVILELPIHW